MGSQRVRQDTVTKQPQCSKDLEIYISGCISTVSKSQRGLHFLFLVQVEKDLHLLILSDSSLLI